MASRSATYRLPPRFYEDHLARDNGRTGRVVRETSRCTVAELDAQAWLDLHSDATLYSEYTVQDLGPEMFGLIASAKATLRALEADPFTDEELAEGQRLWDAEQQLLIDENRARTAEWKARREAEKAEREAEAAAHPRLRTTYYSAARHVFGLETDDDLKVGAILVTESLQTFEVEALGEERRGDIPVTVRRANGEVLRGKIELHTVRRLP